MFDQASGAGIVHRFIILREDHAEAVDAQVAVRLCGLQSEAQRFAERACGETWIVVGRTRKVFPEARVPPHHLVGQACQRGRDGRRERIGHDSRTEEWRKEKRFVDIVPILRQPGGGDTTDRQTDHGHSFTESLCKVDAVLRVAEEVLRGQGGVRIGHTIGEAVLSEAGNDDIGTGGEEFFPEFAELARGVGQSVQ